jgi:hypothetical protein
MLPIKCLTAPKEKRYQVGNIINSKARVQQKLWRGNYMTSMGLVLLCKQNCMYKLFINLTEKSGTVCGKTYLW